MRKIVLSLAATLVLTIGTSQLITAKLGTNPQNTIVSTSLAGESQSLENVSMQSNTETTVELPKEAEVPMEGDDSKPAEEKPIEIVSSSNENTSITAEDSTSSTQSNNTSSAKPRQSLSRGAAPSVPKDTTYDSNNSNKSNNSKYGELLDWWKQVKTMIPTSSTVQVTDLSTGKSFNIKRTFGTNHIDGEAVTVADTNIIKNIWGGFSWERRSVIVNYNGRKIAASMTAMPHAGVDSAPTLATVSNRSDGYGRGENLDAVKNNGMNGVIDIHFLNSTRHKDRKTDPAHQAAILKAAGK